MDMVAFFQGLIVITLLVGVAGITFAHRYNVGTPKMAV